MKAIPNLTPINLPTSDDFSIIETNRQGNVGASVDSTVASMSRDEIN